MPSYSPDQPAGQVDRNRGTARTVPADVTTELTGARRGTSASFVPDAVVGPPGRPGRAETARRWNELVQSYSAPGSDTLLYHVPDRIQRPLGPSARKERVRIDAEASYYRALLDYQLAAVELKAALGVLQ